MVAQRLRLWLAVISFVAWLAILLAGADWPPPLGFLWVVLFDAIAALIVYWRVPVYVDWCATRRRNRALRALLEGLAVGIVTAAIVMVINPRGEPGIPPPLWSTWFLWFAALGIVGAVNAWLVYVGSIVIFRLSNPSS